MLLIIVSTLILVKLVSYTIKLWWSWYQIEELIELYEISIEWLALSPPPTHIEESIELYDISVEWLALSHLDPNQMEELIELYDISVEWLALSSPPSLLSPPSP